MSSFPLFKIDILDSSINSDDKIFSLKTKVQLYNKKHTIFWSNLIKINESNTNDILRLIYFLKK